MSHAGLSITFDQCATEDDGSEERLPEPLGVLRTSTATPENLLERRA
jgi:hypothetical protein